MIAAHECGYEDERFENVVGKGLHCSICFNVFKDPVMCHRNQHIFCRGCITTSLRVSRTCPVCKEHLTVNTLSVAPRVLIECLSELKIRCKFFHRGCQPYVQLEDLERHINNCVFAPATCSNEGCEVTVNKNELLYHETEICEKRKVKCHKCEEVSNKVEVVQNRLNNVERRFASAVNKIDDLARVVNTKLNSMDTKFSERFDGLVRELRKQEYKQEDVRSELVQSRLSNIDRKVDSAVDKIDDLAAFVDEEQNNLNNKVDRRFDEIVNESEQRKQEHDDENLSQEIEDVQTRLIDVERNVHLAIDKIEDMTETAHTKFNSIDSKLARLDDALYGHEFQQQKHNQETKASLDNFMVPLAKVSRIESELTKRSNESLNIFVAGGQYYDFERSKIRSTEKYSKANESWAIDCSMLRPLFRASAVLYHNQLLITGGETFYSFDERNEDKAFRYPATDEIQRMNMDIPAIPRKYSWESSSRFTEFPVKLPKKLSGHCSVVYKDHLYVLGGRDEQGRITADIHEIQLVSPYHSKVVAKMPIARWNHGAQLFGYKIVCVGGEIPVKSAGDVSGACTSVGKESSSASIANTSSTICNTKSVFQYDIKRNVCVELMPLSLDVSEMATVKYDDNIIVIGGVGSNGQPLRCCMMYNVMTQICDSFPGLNEERRGCVAVIHGNSIMVMGGQKLEPYGKKSKGKTFQKKLCSVERFCFERYSWREIRSLNEARYLATAVVY